MKVTRTYLEMSSSTALVDVDDLPLDGTVQQMLNVPNDRYRMLYGEIGRRYRWTDRLAWTDDELRHYLDDPSVSIFVLRCDGHTAGFFELMKDPNGSVEIKYFGLLPAYVGRGLGKKLLAEAVRQAWKMDAQRVWLHTCTLDHPAALPNYLRRGFKPFREETFEEPD